MKRALVTRRAEADHLWSAGRAVRAARRPPVMNSSDAVGSAASNPSMVFAHGIHAVAAEHRGRSCGRSAPAGAAAANLARDAAPSQRL